MQRTKIGVFDSGVGGLSVIKAIQKELPDLEIVYKEDKAHLPYGTKTVEQIHSFVRPIFQEFMDENCRVVVVACNTVTTNLITKLRSEFHVPMVGMEPMIKPAAENTRTGVIAVCATPRTLQSERYKELKHQFAQGISVLEPDCSDWAMMIENNTLDREKVAKTINEACDKGADQVVLGCTHFHWIHDIIDHESANKAEVIQPEASTVSELKRVLAQLP